ncbi:hypothetical protein OIU77_018813 [Salix suchowensis]|nr:sphingosine kinase [Salix suchowensis]KAJ6305547.1 hypothetical protein OIU78_020983 [Salix suchowensis]KAJ6397876.1 hypothetical protein OIU77_018813 [Salix suchowensis]
MLPLKLVRSLILGETIHNPPPLLSHHHHHNDTSSDNNTDTTKTRAKKTKTKIPLLLFLPNNELVTDTYRLTKIARDMGMDLYPTPSLSHIIFSYPSSCTSPSTSPSTPCTSSASLSWASTSSLLHLPNDAIPLPFPSLYSSSITHLRSFASISKGLFKLVFVNSKHTKKVMGGFESDSLYDSNWDCCTFSLFWRLTGDRIDSMDKFSRALAGVGWTLFKTRENNTPSDGIGGSKMVYLFRKVDSKPVYVVSLGNGGECRIRELRLPALDFRNTPLRILHYILLMTDDIFCLS